jgi:preprotein translocase subunit SecE
MGFLSVYKGDQGRAVRIFALVSCLVLTLWACFNLYHWIAPADIPQGSIWLDTDLAGIHILLSPYLVPSIVLFVVALLTFWRVSQKPSVAEFLIETEGELRKMSWPARKEWVNSSLAVLVVIVIFIAFLFAVDTSLSYVFTRLKIGF